MTSPFDAARAAVGQWAPESPAGPLSAYVVADAYAATEGQPARYDAVRGALVATYPAAGYARWLDWLNVQCSYSGPVSVYFGAIEESGRITTYADGGSAEFDPNSGRFIPGGAAVYVVWTVPTSAHTANAVAGFRKVT